MEGLKRNIYISEENVISYIYYTTLMRDKYFLHKINVDRNMISHLNTFIYLRM